MKTLTLLLLLFSMSSFAKDIKLHSLYSDDNGSIFMHLGSERDIDIKKDTRLYTELSKSAKESTPISRVSSETLLKMLGFSFDDKIFVYNLKTGKISEAEWKYNFYAHITGTIENDFVAEITTGKEDVYKKIAFIGSKNPFRKTKLKQIKFSEIETSPFSKVSEFIKDNPQAKEKFNLYKGKYFNIYKSNVYFAYEGSDRPQNHYAFDITTKKRTHLKQKFYYYPDTEFLLEGKLFNNHPPVVIYRGLDLNIVYEKNDELQYINILQASGGC